SSRYLSAMMNPLHLPCNKSCAWNGVNRPSRTIGLGQRTGNAGKRLARAFVFDIMLKHLLIQQAALLSQFKELLDRRGHKHELTSCWVEGDRACNRRLSSSLAAGAGALKTASLRRLGFLSKRSRLLG